MSQNKKLVLALAVALAALPLTGMAQDNPATDPAAEEDESGLSWNAALTSDYVFRGVSQTDEGPAVQGGLDYSWDNGFYVGAWASNVDFGEGSPDVEVDTYVGWNHDVNDLWNVDLMLTRYNYLGEDDDFGDGDYNEFIAAVAYDGVLTGTIGYTNDIYGLSEDAWYYALGATWELGHDIGMDAQVGRNAFADETGIEDYTDWSISINRDFGPVNVAAGWYDTDSDGEYNFGDAADGRFVLTLSIEG